MFDFIKMCVGILQQKFNITLSIFHTKGKPEAVNQKMTDNAMVKRKKQDNRIINFKSQNHKHVFNKSKLKMVERKMILHMKTQKCIFNKTTVTLHIHIRKRLIFKVLVSK